MLTLDQILEKLKDRNLTKVASASGVNVNTLYLLTGGRTIDPTYRTIKKLSDYLEANP